MTRAWKLRLGAAALPMALVALPAAGQETPAEPDTTEAPAEREETSKDVIVTGNIAFRNRTDDPNPVLSYDLEYFQRFEPISVGEMLKRVPGVTFTSDVLEYDQVQFRGLPPGYTQILINGRRAPGGEADRSFFVDRIPAELVEKIEIVRSPRADQPSEGVAGTLNIVTKEAATFEGGFAKAGALINKDGKVRPSLATAYAGRIGERTTYWAALNYQERRNPKKKLSLRFTDATSGPLDETNPDFDDLEYQDDTRDGSDFSGSAEIQTEVGDGGFVRVQGFFVDTDREENERSLELEGASLDYKSLELQNEDIDQKTYAVNADTRLPLGDDIALGLAGAWNGYREDTDNTTTTNEDADDPSNVEIETSAVNLKDDEYNGTAYLAWDGRPVKAKVGIDLLSKTRNGINEGDFLSGDFRIRERRYDPYARLTFEPSSLLSVDAGVRYEITRRRISDLAGASVRYETESLNPSLHLRYAPTAVDQFRASVARTVRRPNYDDISPFLNDETPGDDDVTAGNPALRNERAWGVDVGYERRFAGNGVIGVNGFYRWVDDVVELVARPPTPEAAEFLGDDGQYFTPQNVGKGRTWGMEIDLSAPLTIVGLPDTGLFANYTYLDSRVTDPFTGERRRFNNQPHHLYNAGFIQTVRSVNGSFGATVSGRSKAQASNFDEVVDLRYGADLEAFVEKRLGRSFVLRFSVQDILRRTKSEDFRKYDGNSLSQIREARRAGDIDEYELERERAGPLYQVTVRAAF